MKKAMLVTLYGNTNYGNKLQNYAVYKLISKYGIEVLNVKNHRQLNYEKRNIISFFKFVLSNIKIFYHQLKNTGFKYYISRTKNFKTFSSYINTSKEYFSYSKLKKWDTFDYYVVGSDQVWNPYMALDDLSLFKKFSNGKKIAISASFAVPSLDLKTEFNIKEYLNDFHKISVREESGIDICRRIIEKNVDLQVLIDPTMMITSEEWSKVAKKPDVKYDFSNKYILLAFLGKKNPEVIKNIRNYANSNGYQIIDIYEKNSIWTSCGPSEFLFLEENASLICTDSFHSSVFGILFKTPFIVFNRVGTKENMNSRIETLLKKFDLEECKGKENITDENFSLDFSKTDRILEQERKKAYQFLNSTFEEE